MYKDENFNEWCSEYKRYSKNRPTAWHGWNAALDWVKNHQEPVGVMYKEYVTAEGITVPAFTHLVEIGEDYEPYCSAEPSVLIGYLYLHPCQQPDVAELVDALREAAEAIELFCEHGTIDKPTERKHRTRQALAKWESNK